MFRYKIHKGIPPTGQSPQDLGVREYWTKKYPLSTLRDNLETGGLYSPIKNFKFSEIITILSTNTFNVVIDI